MRNVIFFALFFDTDKRQHYSVRSCPELAASMNTVKEFNAWVDYQEKQRSNSILIAIKLIQ